MTSPDCRLGQAGTAPSLMACLLAPEIEAWHGRADLARLFWLKGVAASLFLIALHARIMLTGSLLIQQLSLLAMAAYTVWIIVAVWRTAGHGQSFWHSLARSLTIAWALNAGFVLLFLQLGLITAWLGPQSSV